MKFILKTEKMNGKIAFVCIGLTATSILFVELPAFVIRGCFHF